MADPQPTPETITFQEARSLPTCDLCDKLEDLLHYPLAANAKSYGKLAFNGFIEIVQCYKDNSVVKQKLIGESGLKEIKAGDEGQTLMGHKVLVVDGAGELGYALLGDRLALKGLENGWSGLIVNGCIRDSKQINEMNIGMKALGTNPRKTKKLGQGVVKDEVTMWGVTFKSGDYLVADEDGIVIIPQQHLVFES